MSPIPDVELVVVQLELEHHAVPKAKVLSDGFTHDWTIIVRGPDDCKIQEFVEKVVFNLHPDFPRCKRVFREPPYSVHESGYAGFEVPIEIYFRNKEEPKKITYNYDLFLHISEAVHNTRREKLTFQNPSVEFKKKLLRAGGYIVGQKNPVKEKSQSNTSSSSSSKVSRHGKQDSVSPRRPPSTTALSPPEQTTIPPQKPHSSSKNSKIHQHRVPGKDISSTQNQTNSSYKASSSSKDKSVSVKSSAKNDHVFTDLFGPPIQARPSDTTSNIKVKTEKKDDKVSSLSSSSTNKRLEDTSVDKKPNKADLDRKAIKIEPLDKKIKPEVSSSEANKDSKAKSSERSRSKEKSSSKKKSKKTRSSSSSSSTSSSRSRKNKKKDTSKEETSSSKSQSTTKTSTKESHSGDKKAKTDNKSAPSVVTSSSTTVQAGSSSHKRKEVKETFSSTKVSFNSSDHGVAFEIESIQKEKSWDSKKSKTSEFKEDGKRSSPSKSCKTEREDSSPVSSIISPTTDNRKTNGKSTPISPEDILANDLELSSESSASTQESSPGKKKKFDDTKSKKDKKKTKKSSSKLDHGSSSNSDSDEDSHPKKKLHVEPSVRDEDYLKSLFCIRTKINEMQDPHTLKKIVHEIESSQNESFKVTDKSVDFDLLKLDHKTVNKIKQIIGD